MNSFEITKFYDLYEVIDSVFTITNQTFVQEVKILKKNETIYIS